MKISPKEFLFGSMESSNSPAGTLNKLDWKKSARMLVVLTAGAIVTTFFDFATSFLINTDLESYQFIGTMLLSSGVLELGRRKVGDFLNTKTG